MADFKLYSYFRSSCSYRVRIALNIKSLQYDYLPIHLIKEGGEQYREEFQKINPSQQVPTLVHNKKTLSQSMAILWYLDEFKPTPALFPVATFARAKAIELCELINSGIQPLQNLSVMRELGHQMGASKEAQHKWNRFWIQRGFQALEKKLERSSGSFSLGGEVSAVDCFLIPQVYNAFRFDVELNEFPNIDRIYKNCLQLTPFKDASPEKQPDAGGTSQPGTLH